MFTDNQLVGKRIKDLREDNDYLQQAIADKLNVTKRTYQKYESGQIELGVRELNLLSDIYKCTVDYILGRTEHMHEGIFEFSKKSDKYKVLYDKREFANLSKMEIKRKLIQFIENDLE